MKKRILLAALFALLLVALLAVSTSAENKYTVDTGDGGAVWQIRHESGEVSLSQDFFDGLKSAVDGDTLTLLTDYIELDEIFTLNTGKRFTVDLGSSKIVYPNNTITEPVLNIRGSTDLTLLANGASICLQNNVRSYISIGDSARLDVIGTGEGLRIMAPDAIDAGGSATVTLDNVRFMKNSGNMMGLVCARGSSTVTVRNSTLVSFGGGNAVYTCGSGRASLYNCRVISLDGTNAAQISDTSSLYAEDTVFSCSIKNQNGGFTVGDGCYLPVGSVYAVAKGATALDCTLTAKMSAESFVAPDGFAVVTAAPCAITQYIAVPTVTDTQTEGSVWRVDNGENTYYTDDFCYPLVNSQEGDRLTLLRDIALDTCVTASLSAESVDLGRYGIRLALPDGLSPSNDAPLFNVVGTGEFTLTAGGEIDLPLALVRSAKKTTLTLDGAHLSLASVATVTAADLTVTGGRIHTTSTALTTVGQGDVFLNATAVTSDTLAVSSGRGVYADGVLLASLSGGNAIAAFAGVTLAENSFVYGSASAASISAADSVYFNTPPTAQLDFIVKPLTEPVICDAYPDLSFGYCASRLAGEVYASFAMSNDLTLNVYLPEYVYSADVFTLISVDGIVYTPTADEARQALLNGEPYLVFSYPYVYASDINERAELRISTRGVGFAYEFTVRELLLDSFLASGSTSFRCAAATYLDYAFGVTGYSPDGDLAATLYPYVSRESIPTPEAPDMLRTVFFDGERGVISLYAAEGVTLEGAVIRWGSTSLTVSADGGALHLLYLRLDPSVTFSLRYKQDGSVKTAELGILSLYATVHGSTGYSTELFVRYLSYLMLISRI